MHPYFCEKRNKYKALIRVGGGVRVSLGWWPRREDAIAAYLSACHELRDTGQITKLPGQRYEIKR